MCLADELNDLLEAARIIDEDEKKRRDVSTGIGPCPCLKCGKMIPQRVANKSEEATMPNNTLRKPNIIEIPGRLERGDPGCHEDYCPLKDNQSYCCGLTGYPCTSDRMVALCPGPGKYALVPADQLDALLAQNLDLRSALAEGGPND